MSSKFVPSKYTAVIHNLREQGFDFGLNDYPIFDESYREKLNKKILDHYDFYEIGQSELEIRFVENFLSVFRQMKNFLPCVAFFALLKCKKGY